MRNTLDREGVAKLLGKSLAQIDRYRRDGDPANGRPPLNDIALPSIGRTPAWREADVLAWAGRPVSVPAEPATTTAAPAAPTDMQAYSDAVTAKFENAAQACIATGQTQQIVHHYLGQIVVNYTMRMENGHFVIVDNLKGVAITPTQVRKVS